MKAVNGVKYPMLLICLLGLIACSEDEPVSPDTTKSPDTSMTGIWELRFDDTWREHLTLTQSDTLLFGDHIHGEVETYVQGAIDSARVIHLVLAATYYFEDGVVATVVIDGQANEDFTEFTGVEWLMDKSTGETIKYDLFNGSRTDS